MHVCMYADASRVDTFCTTRSATRAAAAAAICAAAIVAAATTAPCTAAGWRCDGFLHRTRNALGRGGAHARTRRCRWCWKHRRTVRRRGTPFDPLHRRQFVGRARRYRAFRITPALRTTPTRRTPSIFSHCSHSLRRDRERGGQRESPPLIRALRSPADNTAPSVDRGAGASS